MHNLWEIALMAQALTNRQEELKREYKETKDKRLIEKMYVVKHNLKLINEQLGKNNQ